MTYDPAGRRIVKKIDNSADWNCEYHYYWNGQSMIETRNGSAQVLQQYVWGTQYIDELVQVGVNQDPQNEDPGLPAGQRENLAERFFWVCQDANYNVLGVASAAGLLVERYEYP